MVLWMALRMAHFGNDAIDNRCMRKVHVCLVLSVAKVVPFFFGWHTPRLLRDPCTVPGCRKRP